MKKIKFLFFILSALLFFGLANFVPNKSLAQEEGGTVEERRIGQFII